SQPSKNYVADDGTFHLSQIFDWFTEDFVNETSVLSAYAKQWLPEDAAKRLDTEKPVQFTFYDWGLNQKGADVPESSPSGIQAKILTGLQFIDNLGPMKVVVYGLAYIALSLAFVSAGMLTIAGGFFFGPIFGTIIVSVVSTTAAALAFLISRYHARGFIEKRIDGNDKFAAVDRAVGQEGWKILGLTRLSPLFPFVFLNYAYGLTKVKFAHYVLASWIAMLPGTFVYVWIGSLAKNLTTIAAGGDAGSTPKLILSIVGIAATFAVTAYVTKLAKKALNEKVGEVDDEDAPESSD
ncbi:MAG: TVP38/TMEM64 family protein, partial [Verrucomicrobiota bacterium]